MAEKEKPQRGLASIREARELRDNRRYPSASGRFWVWSFITIAAISIFYWKKTQSENDAQRTRILAKQRGVAAEVGTTWTSLRDQLEKWTIETAKNDWTEDTLDADFRKQSAGAADPPIFKKPGIYLRLTQSAARTPEGIRSASKDSLRDAFSACLLHTPHLDEHQGKACKRSKECDKGQICNELSVCAAPQQPYNLRVAYRGLRVLSPDWVREVETASDELRLRLFEGDLEDAMSNDVAVAVDLLQRAQYFLVVIDEVPPETKPEDGGTIDMAVQSDVHETRVGLFDVKAKKLLFRARRTIDVAIPVAPGAAIEAQRRQVLNCELARDVRESISGP